MPESFAIVTTLPAADLQRAKRFYAERLGLIAESESAAAVEYQAGSSRFGLYRTEARGQAEQALAAWEDNDLDAVVDGLRRRGVTFEEYHSPDLKTVNGIARMGSQRAAWFEDSEGNVLCVAKAAGAL